MSLMFVIALASLPLQLAAPAGRLAPEESNALAPSPGAEVLELACLECHGSGEPEAGFDLERMLASADPQTDLFAWRYVRSAVEAGSMPPPGAGRLDDDETHEVIEWLDSIEKRAFKLGGAPGHEPARRLTRGELGRSLRELLGVRVDVEALMPRELVAENAFETSGATLFVHAEWLQRADVVVREALRRSELNPETFELRPFLRRAFRRPATKKEVERYSTKRANRVAAGSTPEAALRDTLFDALASPHFRLRLEDAAPSDDKDRPVSPFGLASRLSFLVWSAPPDDRLLDLAAAGELAEESVLARELARLLDDKRAEDFAHLFAGQWLGTRRLGREVKPDPIDNPAMTDSLMAAMRSEVALFLLMLLREDRPLDDLFRAPDTFLTPELARFYGLDDDFDGTERRMHKARNRRGLLGKAAALASTSYPDRTSPVIRGAWILDDLLGTPPPPPPPGASDFDDEVLEEAEEKGPLALLALHRSAPSCAACHDRIDPLGAALEGFDRFGRARGHYEDDEPIDTGGRLPTGEAFEGPQGLGRALLASRRIELAREISRRFLTYALGRPLAWTDERTVVELGDVLEQDGFGALLRALIGSRPFRHVAFEGDRR